MSSWVSRGKISIPITRSAMMLTSLFLPQQPAPLARPVALLLGLTLVVQLLALGQRDLDLGAALVVEIDLERHDGHALALDRTHQLVDLAAMQQELARPLRRMVEATGLLVFGDVGVDQPQFTVTRRRVGLSDAGLAGAQRLDLAAGERHARLEGLVDRVIEPRLAVIGDELEFGLGFGGHLAAIDQKRPVRSMPCNWHPKKPNFAGLRSVARAAG